MPKLSILAALKHMIQLIANNWKVAARFSLPWLALLAVLDTWQFLSNPSANMTPGNIKFNGSTLLLIAVNLVASSSIAVSWHRHILIDEPQSSVRPFRIDKTVLSYLRANFVIIIITVVPMIAVIMASTFFPTILLPLWLALTIAITLFSVRLALSLPAIAIGRTDFGLQAALASSQKNNLQIFGLLIATGSIVLGIFVVMQILISLSHSISPTLSLPASVILGIPFQFLVLLLTTAMQTSLYGYFCEGRKF